MGEKGGKTKKKKTRKREGAHSGDHAGRRPWALTIGKKVNQGRVTCRRERRQFDYAVLGEKRIGEEVKKKKGGGTSLVPRFSPSRQREGRGGELLGVFGSRGGARTATIG